MSQAPSGSSNTSAPLGVQAAAAATSGGASKPASTTTATPSNDAAASSEEKQKNKLFIVEGKIHEFDTPAQAEKFLNAPGAPTQYSVLRGKQVKSKQKVTLR